MPNSEIRTRFAPSPTGFLHIGNVRTALFNYLFSKKNGGKFLLRIEDTDRARSGQAAVEAIFSGLQAIGLQYDCEAVFQSKGEARHREIAEQLLASGHAYRSYAEPKEIEEIKLLARENNQKPVYPGGNGEVFSADLPCVIRFKAPNKGSVINEDLVQGRVEVHAKDLDDMVLLRSDGTPTYMLSAVVDDIDMKITHVIRGDDHLINACRQIPLFEALGKTPPKYAHIPLIHGSDGAKLSKRHGAVGLKEWLEEGYLKESIINYLCGLGWTFKDKEIFSLEEASAVFDLSDINRAAAKLDYAKLSYLSGVYLRAANAEEITKRYHDYRSEIGLPALLENEKKRIMQTADLFKERAATFADFHKEVAFLLNDVKIERDEKSKLLLSDLINQKNLIAFCNELSGLAEWNCEEIAKLLKEFLQTQSLKMPQIGPVIRAAIAGRTATPEIPPILAALGKVETVKRLTQSAA